MLILAQDSQALQDAQGAVMHNCPQHWATIAKAQEFPFILLWMLGNMEECMESVTICYFPYHCDKILDRLYLYFSNVGKSGKEYICLTILHGKVCVVDGFSESKLAR